MTNFHITSTAYTAGPWKVCGESLNDGEAFVVESESRTICWTSNSLNGDEQVTTNEDESNSRLIAAAPDLLVALQKLLDALDRDIEGLEPEAIEAIKVADEVIAKI